MILKWRIWLEAILPVMIFPAITATIFPLLFGGLFKSGAAKKLTNLCDPSNSITPYRLNYVGIGTIDDKLCTLVSFFQAALDEPSSIAFITDFIILIATLVTVLNIEAARNGRNVVLAFPLCIGFMYQLYSLAAVLPLYWLLFVVTGAASLHRHPGQFTVDKGRAESVLFSVCTAFLVPSAAMIVFKDAYFTVIWQAFPALMAITQLTYRLLRTSSQPGRNTIRATYVILFILSSMYHIAIIWPKMGDFAALKHMFLPSVHPLDPLTTSLGLATLDFLQWDYVFAFASTALATFWFARSVQDVLVIVLWYITAAGSLGPGAAIAGVFLWRETMLDSKGR